MSTELYPGVCIRWHIPRTRQKPGGVSEWMQRKSARPGEWSGVSLGPWSSPLAVLFIGYFGKKCGNFKTGGSV